MNLKKKFKSSNRPLKSPNNPWQEYEIVFLINKKDLNLLITNSFKSNYMSRLQKFTDRNVNLNITHLKFSEV